MLTVIFLMGENLYSLKNYIKMQWNMNGYIFQKNDFFCDFSLFPFKNKLDVIRIYIILELTIKKFKIFSLFLFVKTFVKMLNIKVELPQSPWDWGRGGYCYIGHPDQHYTSIGHHHHLYEYKNVRISYKITNYMYLVIFFISFWSFISKKR